jgi:DNA-directed RNA polymerase subunit E'/Rpb7
MDPMFERRQLSNKVHVHSKYIQKNMLPSILAQLKTTIEGRCISEGYVQKDSITVISYSLGRVNQIKGGVDYDVVFQADICFPHPGQIFKAAVALRSKIGVHADVTPLNILIPRDLHIGNQEFEQLELNQDFEFEVIGPQFKQQDKVIVVVGRLRTALKPAPLQPLLHAIIEPVVPILNQNIGTNNEEKIVTVLPTETTTKKTRKLKKPNVSDSNESPKVGMDERTN